mgnify:CR=1 FL=1
MMRILLILLSLSYIFPLISVGQEKVKFKELKVNDAIFLSIENEKLEEKKRTYKLGGFSFEREGTLKWFRDYQRLLQKEFPNVSDEEYAYLKHIRWYIWICDDGTCQHSSFLIREPEETFKHVKDLEIHLANLVEQMDSLRFQPDQIVVWDPRYKNKSMGETIVPFFYLRKKIDDK